jgi:UMF1 family MFS transporter
MSSDSVGSNRGRIFAWTLFDFGNTAFSVIIVTVIYSTYFTDHVAGGKSSLWGLAVSLSMISAALISPPLGAAADYSRNRKRFLLFFTLLCVVCTALMTFVDTGMATTGVLLFVLANLGFEGGLVFYDAFLPALTSKKNYGRVSGYGFAMGYVGALAILLLVGLMLPPDSDPSYYPTIRQTFLLAAGFFLIFSFPLFLIVPEPPQSHPRRASYILEGIRTSARTFRSLFIHGESPAVARFLIAFFLYNDGVLTIIAFAAIFAKHILMMSLTETIAFFAVVQTSAIIGSVVFGIITDKIGPRKTITITLYLWIAITIAAFFVQSKEIFYVVAFAAGIAVGSSQSASRTLMALLTPRDREAEYFGFYNGLCGKASAVAGPMIYGLVADVTDERSASLAISVFFVAGLILLQGVKEPERIDTPVL